MTIRKYVATHVISYTDTQGSLAWLIPLQDGDGSWFVLTEDGPCSHSGAADVRAFVEEWLSDMGADGETPTAAELETFAAHEALAQLFDELGAP